MRADEAGDDAVGGGRNWLHRHIVAVVTVALAGTVLSAGTVALAAAGAAPTIDVWYGNVQPVGETGRTQEWANVLGRVTDTDDAVASLSYTLNGGAARPLMIGNGDNNPRLVRGGDFNVEIDRDQLVAGANTVVIRATDAAGNTTQRTVTLQNTPATTWPLPTMVDWDGVTTPNDVVDVVDGRWTATSSGARVVDDGYDRLLAVGDMTWTDYVVEVPVTVHSFSPNVSAVGFLMRWTGHTDAPPHEAGQQPLVGWEPSGALAWYRGRYEHENQPRAELALADETVLTRDASGFTLATGTTYIFRASVRRIATGDQYTFTVFPQGQPESSGVTMTALDTGFSKDAGSALLLAHRASVTFGDIVVTEPGGDPPPPVNRAPVAVGDVASTSVGVPVSVNVLANDSDSDGSLVPSSVAVAGGPAHGSVSVNTGSGAVTYTPAAGFVGSDSFSYTVRDDDGAVSNVASVSVTVTDPDDPPPPSESGLVSDEFSSTSLGSHWSWLDPVGDASAVATGTHVALSVPQGVSHDLWAGSLRGPRLLQAVNDVDFEVEAKIDSVVGERFEMQGLVVQQDADDLIRAELHHDGGGTRLFVATISGDEADVVRNVSAPAAGPYWLRLGRVGDTWTFSYSTNGTAFTTVATFVHQMTASQAGLWVGNYNPSPAHTASIDYFRDTAAGPGGDPGDPPPPVNQAPVAVGDVASTSVGVPVSVNVLANDSDSDGSLVPSSVAVVGAPAHGSVSVNPGSGAVTYAPAAGFAGSDSFTYRVSDDDGASSNAATVSVAVTDPEDPPPPSGSGLVSDEFSSTTLGSHWSWLDPVGDASAVATGTHVALSVPQGVSHDLWAGSLQAPRLLQAVNDVDFVMEARIDSVVGERFEMQGLVVQQDADDLIRAELHHDGGGTRLFVATISGDEADVVRNVSAPAAGPYWLRLGRVGDTWTFSYSTNGTAFTTVATFVHQMTASQAGLFAGNHNPSPAHTATFDYFRAS